MDKVFGLSLFCSFFAVGILLGSRREPLRVSTAFKTLGAFVIVFVLLGLLLTLSTDFLKPT